MAAACPHSPLKNLPAPQMMRGCFKQALAIRLHGSHPFALLIRNTVEEVLGYFEVDRIGTVAFLFRFRYANLAQPIAGASIVAFQRLIGGGQHTRSGRFVDGDIAPPIHRNLFPCRVMDAHLNKQCF